MNNINNVLIENICNNYRKELQRFIYTLTRKDQFAADDIFQDTMEKAYKNLKYLRDNDKLKSWIFAIAKTEARRYYASNKKYYYYETDELDEDVLQIDDSDDFTELIIDNYLIIQLLNNFSEKVQQIFLLHYYYDLPLNEISQILHINYNTIRSIHNRGISKMKKIYLEKGIKNENKGL